MCENKESWRLPKLEEGDTRAWALGMLVHPIELSRCPKGHPLHRRNEIGRRVLGLIDDSEAS